MKERIAGILGGTFGIIAALASIAVSIIIFAVFANLGSDFVHMFQHDDVPQSAMTEQAKATTQRNAGVNACLAGVPADSGFSDDVKQSYCSCVTDALIAEYGISKLNDDAFASNLNTNGFNQHDTLIIQQCLSQAGA